MSGDETKIHLCDVMGYRVRLNGMHPARCCSSQKLFGFAAPKGRLILFLFFYAT